MSRSARGDAADRVRGRAGSRAATNGGNVFVEVPVTEREKVRTSGEALDSVWINTDHIVKVMVSNRKAGEVTHWTALLTDVSGRGTSAYLGSGLSEQDVEKKLRPFLNLPEVADAAPDDEEIPLPSIG